VGEQLLDDLGGRSGPVRGRVENLVRQPLRLARHRASRSKAAGTSGAGSPAPPLLRRRVHQPAREPGEENRVLGVQADVGHPQLHGRIARRQPCIEVGHRLVEHHAGGEHRVQQRPVGVDRAQHLDRPGHGPPTPQLSSEARIAGVLAPPERRVGGQRREHRQPHPRPVEHAHSFCWRVDRHVNVAAAGELLVLGEPEVLGQPQVAALGSGERLAVQRRDRQRGDPCPDRSGGLVGHPATLTYVVEECAQLLLRLGAGLDLLLLELRVQVLAELRCPGHHR
jgi:hypothetical protein